MKVDRFPWRLESRARASLSWAALAGVLVVYLVVAVVFTLPVAWWIGERCWGGRFDFFTNLWFCWYLDQAVDQGSLPGWVDLLLYPVGEDFFFAYGHCFVELISVPLQRLFGLTVAYNLLSFLALGFSGFGAFLLTLHVTGSRSAAWLGGLLFECSSYLYSELTAGSVEVAFAGWLPIYLLSLLRTLETGRWKQILLAALALFLTAGSNFLYGMMACFLTAMLALWEVARRRDPDPLFRCSAVVLLFLLAMTPYLTRMFEHVPARSPMDLTEMKGVADLEARFGDGYEPLSAYDFSARRGLESLEVYTNSAQLPIFLRSGLTFNPMESAPEPWLWGAAALGIALAGRQVAVWGVTLLAAFTLSLGPFLRTSTFPSHRFLETDVVLPFYYLYNHLPLMSMIYRPYRFQVVTLLALAVLSGVAWTMVLRRLAPGRPRQLAMWAGLLLLTNPVLLQPFRSSGREALPLASTEVPEWYRALASEPGDFALMDLPFYGLPPSLNQSRYIYYQTVHGKKILSTVFIRNDTVERFLELYRANSAIRWIVDAGEGTFSTARVLAKDVDQLVELGYRYAVLHTEFDLPIVSLVNGSEHKQVFDVRHQLGLEQLFGPPEIHPGGLEVFRMDRFRARHPRGEEVVPIPPEIKVRDLSPQEPVLGVRMKAEEVSMTIGPLDRVAGLAFWLSTADACPWQEVPVELYLDDEVRPFTSLVLKKDRYRFIRLDLPGGRLSQLRLKVPEDRVGAPLIMARPQAWSREP